MLTPRVLDTVMLQEESGEFFALDLNTGEVFSLNSTAAQILRMCEQGLALPEMISHLRQALHEPVDPQLIQQDVEETLQTFVHLGLCAY